MVTGGFADEDGVLRSMLVQIQPSASAYADVNQS